MRGGGTGGPHSYEASRFNPDNLITFTFFQIKVLTKMLVFVYRKYFLYKKYRNTIFCLCVCFLVICFFYVPSQLPMVEAGASKKKVSSGSATLVSREI